MRRSLKILTPLAILAAVVAARAAFDAPLERRTEGIVQKTMYVHVPSAWAMYLAFAVTFVGSIVYLTKQSRRADQVAAAAAEVGVFFCTLVLITGPLWARPIWGVWWSWDARLTSTLVLWFIYVGYLVIRGVANSGAQGARFSAVISILSFPLIWVIHKSVEWWHTLHPQSKTAGGGRGLAPGMLKALLVSGFAFLVIAIFLIVLRAVLEDARERRAAAQLGRGGGA